MTLHLYGLPGSTFVWTVRLLLHEKSVDYEIGMKGTDSLFAMQRSPDIERHPFRKVPIIEHDGRRVFETQAICRYIDRAFGGPVFTPKDAYDAAVNDQWMGAIATYLDSAIIRQLVLPIVIGKAQGKPANQDQVERAIRDADVPLAAVDGMLEGKTFLTGESPVLADFFLWPILFYMKRLPVTARLLKAHTNLEATLKNAMARPAFAETIPA